MTAARVEAMIGATCRAAQAVTDTLAERGELVEVAGRERRRISAK